MTQRDRSQDARIDKATRWSAMAAQVSGEDPACYMGEAWLMADKVISGQEAKRRLVATFAPASENDVQEGNDLPDPDSIDTQGLCNAGVCEELHDFYTRRAIHSALMKLPHREHRILALLYGIGCQPFTQKEVAEQFDLTTTRIMQISSRAMIRFKHPWYWRDLRGCLDDAPIDYDFQKRRKIKRRYF